jgi:hypothetical protein
MLMRRINLQSLKKADPPEKAPVIEMKEAFFQQFGIDVEQQPIVPDLDLALYDGRKMWGNWGEAAALMSAAYRSPFNIYEPSCFAFYQIFASGVGHKLGHIYALFQALPSGEPDLEFPPIVFLSKKNGRVRELGRVEWEGRRFATEQYPMLRWLSAESWEDVQYANQDAVVRIRDLKEDLQVCPPELRAIAEATIFNNMLPPSWILLICTRGRRKR